MPTYRAYCSTCDAEIDVRMGPDGPRRLELRDLACPHDELCGDERCVLSHREGEALLEMLEFVPPGEEPGRGRGFGKACRQVESARRTSLAREMRRFREWWEGR